MKKLISEIEAYCKSHYITVDFDLQGKELTVILTDGYYNNMDEDNLEAIFRKYYAVIMDKNWFIIDENKNTSKDNIGWYYTLKINRTIR